MFNKKDKKDEEKKDKKDKKTKKEDKKDPGKKQNSSASASEDEPTPTSTNPSPRPPATTQTSPTTTSPVDTQAAAKKVEDEKKAEEDKKKAEAEKKRKEEEEKLKAATSAPSATEDKKEKKEKKPEKEHKKSDKPSEKASDENIDAEVHSLESVKLDASENAQTYKDQFNLLSKDVYVAFDKLQNFARDLNTQIPVPEFVVVGKKGHGKSSIIESFFGEQVNAVGSGGVTKRPFYLSLINNLSCETPRITLKRDPAIREFDHDVEVKIGEVSSEVAKRLKVSSEEPVILQYESKSVCNLTFIDTPGLLDEDEGEVSKEERETSVLNLAKPTHRYIIAVEASREWSRMELVNIIKKVDPELTRTTFVYSKFYSHLQSFTSTREVNKFLSGTLPDVKTFFTTVPSEGVRSKFNDADKFQQKIWQTYKRDINGLEQLQFDKRFENNVGVLHFRKYVLGLAWKNYQESIPKILKQLRAKKVDTEKSILEAERELKSLDSSKLRSIASQYVVNFLQIVERLIAGTSEGNPVVNGQTLEEEKSAHGDGDWVDSYNRTIRFEPEEWSIPYWNNKLYGGQQFERLLAEYKAVSDHTEISEVTMDDVATAAGINKLNNIPNYMWAASDLAQQKSQDAFGPLIEQLSNRAIYIMKRLTDIAEKILESRRKKWTGPGNPVDDIDRYPYFTYHVKDLFNKYVEHTARVCKEKCMDEFYSTRTILWDFTEFADKSLPLERNDQEDTRSSVVQLSKELFNSLRDRITKNVLLKLYNFFLVPMQTELWNEIQGKVNSLSDGALEQIFEVTATKDKLKNKITHLQEELSKGAEQDKLFMEYAATFSHPLASLATTK